MDCWLWIVGYGLMTNIPFPGLVRYVFKPAYFAIKGLGVPQLLGKRYN
jgi:hypothetical protein